MTYALTPIATFSAFRFYIYLLRAYDQKSIFVAHFPIQSRTKDINSYMKLYGGDFHRLDIPQIMVIILMYLTCFYEHSMPLMPTLSLFILCIVYFWQKVSILKCYRQPVIYNEGFNEQYIGGNIVGAFPFVYFLF